MTARMFLTAMTCALASTVAHADVDLLKVPVACGTLPDVVAVLQARMPNPRAVAKGGDSHGEDVALLLSDGSYWALIAKTSPGIVCVVASGYSWTTIEPTAPPSF